MLHFILKELAGADSVRVLKDAPALGTGTAHLVAESVSYLQAMMGEDTNSAYTKLVYGVSSDSDLSNEEHKPHARKHKKSQCSKLQGGHTKQKKDRENNNDKWIMVTGNGKTKNLLNPKPNPKVHNAFAILSQPDTPTNYNMLSPTQQIDNNKTIIPPGPREHRRQQKIAQRQHIKQTLRRLCKSDNLFLDNSITQAKDEHTAITKNNTNNTKHVAINSAHAQRNQPTIRLAQRGQNTAYCLGSAFNLTIKKLNKNKQVSFAKQNKVHLFNATSTPRIMFTYDSGANGHYISKHDQHKAGIPILRPSTLGS